MPPHPLALRMLTATMLMFCVVAGLEHSLPLQSTATATRDLQQQRQRLWSKFRFRLGAPHMPNAHQPSVLAQLPAHISAAASLLEELVASYHGDSADASSPSSLSSFSSSSSSPSSSASNASAFVSELRDFHVRINNFHQVSQATSTKRGHYRLAPWLEPRAWERSSLQQHGAVDVPLVTYLVVEYVETRVAELRALLLRCLQLGADPNAVSPWTIASAPVMLFLSLRVPVDLDLAIALARAGAAVGAHYSMVRVGEEEEVAEEEDDDDNEEAAAHSQPPGAGPAGGDNNLGSVVATGVSILQAACQDFEQRTLVRRLLSLVDEYVHVSCFPSHANSTVLTPTVGAKDCEFSVLYSCGRYFYALRTQPAGTLDARAGSESLDVAFKWLSQVSECAH
jgi:hypothetical protein